MLTLIVHCSGQVMQVVRLQKIRQQIVKVRTSLDAPMGLPPALITRPEGMRREHFQKKVKRLINLEQQFEDIFVAGIEQHKRSK